MGLIPVPPAAYWEQIPWWAFLILLAVIGVLASPFTVQLLRGRAGSYASREQTLADSQARLEKERTSHEASLRQDYRDARSELEDAREMWAREREAIEHDRDDGWDAGRGMEDIAHYHRHQYSALASRFNAFCGLFWDHVDGRMASERALALLSEIRPLEPPPQVPLLRDVKRKPHVPPGKLVAVKKEKS